MPPPGRIEYMMYGLSTRMSPRWGSNTKHTYFLQEYRSSGAERQNSKTATRRHFVFEPHRGEILVDTYVFCIRAPAGRHSYGTFQSGLIN